MSNALSNLSTSIHACSQSGHHGCGHDYYQWDKMLEEQAKENKRLNKRIQHSKDKDKERKQRRFQEPFEGHKQGHLNEEFGLGEILKKWGGRKQPKQKALQNLDWWGDRCLLIIAICNEDNILDQISRKTTAKKPVGGEMAVRLPDLSFPSQKGEQIKNQGSWSFCSIQGHRWPCKAFRSRDRSFGGIFLFFSSKCGMYWKRSTVFIFLIYQKRKKEHQNVPQKHMSQLELDD